MARDEPRFAAARAYVAQLSPDLFGRRRTRRRIAEEIQGHLEDSIERHVADGMDVDAAQRRAIEEFGPPQVVIASWAESKGLGMVTDFTRFGGLAGIVGALGLSVAMAWADTHWSFSRGSFAEVALTFGALLAIGMVALYVRLRGKLGRFGRAGFASIVAGLVVGLVSSMFWFAPGGGVALVLLVGGAGLYLTGALRAEVVPRGPLLLWSAGFAAAVVAGFAGTIFGIETGFAAMALGYGLFDAGWIWLGVHLWNETVVHPEPHEPAHA